MKMNHFSTGTLAGLAVAGILFAATNLGHADGDTNAASSPHTNGISIKITAGHENSPSDNYYGMPKEAFDRLSPEQIMELAKIHHETFSTEQIPDLLATILIPTAMFTMIAVCVWLGVSSRLKRNQMLHETIRQMIEKGQPIPPELLQPTDQCRPRSDLRRGLIFVATGIGLGVWFLVQHNGVWPVALIPLLIGVAFLITCKLESNKNRESR